MSKRILLLEDQADNRKIIRDMLRATVSDVANSCEQEGISVAAA
jgi:hypothetical protein